MLKGPSPDTIFGNLSGDFNRRADPCELHHPTPVRARLQVPSSLELRRQQVFPVLNRASALRVNSVISSTGSPPDSLKYSLSPLPLQRFDRVEGSDNESFASGECSPGLTEDSEGSSLRSILKGRFGYYKFCSPNKSSMGEVVQFDDQQASVNHLHLSENASLAEQSTEMPVSIKVEEGQGLRRPVVESRFAEKTSTTRISEENRHELLLCEGKEWWSGSDDCTQIEKFSGNMSDGSFVGSTEISDEETQFRISMDKNEPKAVEEQSKENYQNHLNLISLREGGQSTKLNGYKQKPRPNRLTIIKAATNGNALSPIIESSSPLNSNDQSSAGASPLSGNQEPTSARSVKSIENVLRGLMKNIKDVFVR